MTGRFPGSLGIHSALSGNNATNAERGNVNFLDPDTFSVTRLFQENGYLVGHFGKWHLGDTANPPSPSPHRYGVNVSATYASFNDTPLGDQSDPFWPAQTSKIIIDHAIDMMKNATARGVPFYMNLWFHISHATLNPTAEQKAVYGHGKELINSVCRLPSTNETTCPHLIYWASQSDADQQIGRLFEAMKNLNVDERTIVAFTTDNGPEEPTVYFNAVGSAGPFRGRKRSLYEGGHRLPFIVRWPGKIPANKVDHSILSGADWLPTVASLTGLNISDDVQATFDGEDMSATFMSPSTTQDRKKPLFWEWRWKMSGPCWHRSPRLAVRNGEWKFFMNPDGTNKELYNLGMMQTEAQTQFYEVDNIATRPEQASLVASLSDMLLKWWNTLPKGPVADPTDNNSCQNFPFPTETKN